jgi:hypothetical protein
MGKHTPDSLLVFAYRFQKLAQSGLENMPDPSFIRKLKQLTGADPTPEQWKNWIEANKTVVGSLLNNYWSLFDSRSIYANIGAQSAYITVDSKTPHRDFEPSSIAILKASAPIPPLWLQIGTVNYDAVRREMPSPTLGHYAWLADGISKVMGYAPQRDMVRFVTDNKKKIDSVRRLFQTQQPKYLGGGADGAAYDIGGGKVLKIFRDITSYEKALMAFDRLHKSPELAKTEAMIYDIGTLGKFGGDPGDPASGSPVYYYIIETMKTLRDVFGEWSNIPLRKILEFIAGRIADIKGTKLKVLKKDINDPAKAALIRKVVKEEAAKLASDIKDEDFLKPSISKMETTIPNLKPNWLELYVEEVIMKYLTGRTDLHMGNIGVTHYGELRYFDPAYGGHESEINT